MSEVKWWHGDPPALVEWVQWPILSEVIQEQLCYHLTGGMPDLSVWGGLARLDACPQHPDLVQKGPQTPSIVSC